MARNTFPCEFKSGEEEGVFHGCASAYYRVDDSSYNDVIAPGAFDQDLGLFLREGFIGGLNHDWDEPIGKPIEARSSPEGLMFTAKISDTARGRDARTLMRDGVIKTVSVGFRVMPNGADYLEEAAMKSQWAQWGYTPSDEDLTKASKGCRVVRKARLYEISPVTIPANKGAVIMGVKNEGDASITLSDHSDRVLAQLGEYKDRIFAVKRLREKDGRTLSPALAIALKQILAELDVVVKELGMSDTDNTSTAAALEAEFLAIQARSLGVSL